MEILGASVVFSQFPCVGKTRITYISKLGNPIDGMQLNVCINSRLQIWIVGVLQNFSFDSNHLFISSPCVVRKRKLFYILSNDMCEYGVYGVLFFIECSSQSQMVKIAPRSNFFLPSYCARNSNEVVTKWCDKVKWNENTDGDWEWVCERDRDCDAYANGS